MIHGQTRRYHLLQRRRSALPRRLTSSQDRDIGKIIMIILSQELVTEHLQAIGPGGQVVISFISLDDGDVFISRELASHEGRGGRVVNGLLSFRNTWQEASIDHLP